MMKIRILFNNYPKDICLRLGRIYIFFGLSAVIVVLIQKFILSEIFNSSNYQLSIISKMFNSLILSYMPVLMAIGIAYLFLGFFFDKINRYAFQINLGLIVLYIIWALGYSYNVVKYFESYCSVVSGKESNLKFLTHLFLGFGVFVILEIFAYPQYRLGKKIKELER